MLLGERFRGRDDFPKVVISSIDLFPGDVFEVELILLDKFEFECLRPLHFSFLFCFGDDEIHI